MTREEIIQEYEGAVVANGLAAAAGNEEAMRSYELFKAGLDALRPVSREQVERMRGEWQVCFEDWRKQMAGDQCSKCGFQHYGTSTHHYKFCPACGAPMTDEAVDILLKRIADMPTLTPPNEPLPVLVNDEPDREYIDYICPRCKNTISQRRRGQRMETVYQCKYHDNCGQRVDWSNPQPYRLPSEGAGNA